MYQCYACKAPWESSLRQPAVKEVCGNCGAYLHCCRNCTYHRAGYPNECYIPDTEKIADRSRANFCDEFEFVSDTTLAERGRRAQNTDSSLAQLFGEVESRPEPESDVKEWLKPSDKVKQDFEDLFGE